MTLCCFASSSQCYEGTIILRNAKYEVLTVLFLQIHMCWDTTVSLCEWFRTYLLLGPVNPWRCRRYVSSKYWEPLTEQHTALCQNNLNLWPMTRILNLSKQGIIRKTRQASACTWHQGSYCWLWLSSCSTQNHDPKRVVHASVIMCTQNSMKHNYDSIYHPN